MPSPFQFLLCLLSSPYAMFSLSHSPRLHVYPFSYGPKGFSHAHSVSRMYRFFLFSSPLFAVLLLPFEFDSSAAQPHPFALPVSSIFRVLSLSSPLSCLFSSEKSKMRGRDKKEKRERERVVNTFRCPNSLVRMCVCTAYRLLHSQRPICC